MKAAAASGRFRRVVVTGIGVVSPIGNTLQESWRKVLDGNYGDHRQGLRCGVTTLEEALAVHQDLSPDRFEREWSIARTLPCQVAAPVRGLKESFLEYGEQNWNPRTTARFVQLALLAGSQAMQQANLAEWLKEDDHDDGEEAYFSYIGPGKP